MVWYLSALSVIGRRLLIPDPMGAAIESGPTTTALHMDGEMLFAIAYPVVSMGFGMASINRDPATFAVSCQVTSAASFLGLLALASSQGLRFATDSLLLGEIVVVLWSVIPGNQEMVSQVWVVMWTSWAVAGNLGKAKWNPINLDRRIRAVAFLGSHALVTLVWPCSYFIPPTGASLTDLDQAAALSIELVILMYQWRSDFMGFGKEIKQALIASIRLYRGGKMVPLHSSWYSRPGASRQRERASQQSAAEEGLSSSHANL